ncbi:ATPase involved in chromosome partitioning [Candidatus Terasakiella magnetica]|uniref:ATPase involved in chromosome partitioning n=1 Tax=Candidatus Terasakiella magnetica TaxID=1867952 RepID=A0A1C3RCK3_9PROT|nr:ParA family partition ATPase [Candidatus Terasakiella magnetica]SCA54978.1 ATPase involved in chromosome partitioning [Candidatus Terasakiella magnetica]
MAAKILTIAQQKGGAGKTTVVAQLATAYAAQKKNVALVDIDPQASLTSWFAERKRSLGEDNRLVLSSVGGWRLKNELDRLKQDFDVILVDAPPHAQTEASIAIRYADLLVIPVQPSPMDVWATAPTFKQAKKEKTDAIVLLNRIPPRGKLLDKIRNMLEEDERPMLKSTLGNRVAFASSMIDGLGVVESEKRSTATTEIKALAKEIWGK